MADLLEEVGAGKIRPVYFVSGEPYPRNRLVQAVRQAVVGDASSAFNYDGFEGKEATAAKILGAARTLPMLGGQRLVQVRDAHLLSADELAGLLDYVKDPSPQSCLLMAGDKVDGRLKFFVALKKLKHVGFERFEPLKERQVPGWVTAEARRNRIKLAPGTAERIADAVGTDMGQLASAVEQLSLYVAGVAISPEHVEELLAQTRQRSIFELTNAVGRGNRREAMLAMRQMMQARESGIRIVAMLTRHLRQLWMAKELSAAGEPNKAIASAVGMHPFFLNDMLKQARRFDDEMLARTHRALFQADRALKSSRLADPLVMDQLVMSLC